MKGTYFLSVESYTDLFVVTTKELKTQEIRFLKIGSDSTKQDCIDLYNYVSTLEGYTISFGGSKYDEIMLYYLVKEFKESIMMMPPKQIAFELYVFSEKVLHSMDNVHQDVRPYAYPKGRKYKAVDLLMFWSKKERLQKRLNLRRIAIQLRFADIKQTPFYPNHSFTNKPKDIEALADYIINFKLRVVEELFKTKREEVILRFDIFKNFKMDCFSYDAGKIANEYFLEEYARKTYRKDSGRKYWEYKNDIRGRSLYDARIKVGYLLTHIKVELKDKVLKQIDEELRENIGDYNKKVIFSHNGIETILSPSSGGLHSINNNETYSSNEDEIVIDADINSLYPTLLKNYKFIRRDMTFLLDKYEHFYNERVKAKAENDFVKDKFYKLMLVSFIGILDQAGMWCYSPNEMLALRTLGQIIQLKTLDELAKIGAKVFYVNTDGNTAIVKRKDLNKYFEVMQNIEKEFGVQWEYSEIDDVIINNSNSLLATINKTYTFENETKRLKGGLKVKRIGDNFRYGEDIPVGGNFNNQIIAKALEAYFLNGTPPSEYIPNWKKNGCSILDFCFTDKITKGTHLCWGNERIDSVSRYYFSNNGKSLEKTEVGSLYDNIRKPVHKKAVSLLNEYKGENFEFDINYSAYISEAKKIIDDIECSNTQLRLF